MTDHADTIRRALIEFFADSASRGRGLDGIYGRREAALSALDALVAENERLREALDQIRLYAKAGWVGDEYATPERALDQIAFDAADALAGGAVTG